MALAGAAFLPAALGSSGLKLSALIARLAQTALRGRRWQWIGRQITGAMLPHSDRNAGQRRRAPIFVTKPH
jgi:hypothetical protein